MSGAATQPAVEIRDLWIRYRGMAVLEGVDLTVAQHELLGIIGPNGGGKSTLLRAILGLARPDRGVVQVFGRPPEQAHGLVAYVPQHARFDPGFPIRVLDVVLHGRLGRRRLLQRWTREDREVALAALADLRLDSLAARQIGRLSGGQLQRVLVARALASGAPLLLLDEPTSSLDPQIGKELYELLERLCTDKTIVLVSHDIGVMSRHVHNIACLNRRVLFHDSQTLTQERLESTYGSPVSLLLHEHHHIESDAGEREP
jgi:zinc transport system ATP-binding protein